MLVHCQFAPDSIILRTNTELIPINLRLNLTDISSKKMNRTTRSINIHGDTVESSRFTSSIGSEKSEHFFVLQGERSSVHSWETVSINFSEIFDSDIALLRSYLLHSLLFLQYIRV